jgi:hypothetical protein
MSGLQDRVGRYGIWSSGLRSEDPALRAEIPEAAAELEELGYGAVWLGGSSGVQHAVPLIEATSELTVAPQSSASGSTRPPMPPPASWSWIPRIPGVSCSASG